MLLEEKRINKRLADSITHVKDDISTLRTGKASLDMLDPVRVESYGAKMKVNELAKVSVPDYNMILIEPWNSDQIANIEQAIHKSNLNLNPVVDGEKIRIIIPQLTEERRKEMVKILHQKIESGKVLVRNIRSDFKKEIEAFKGEDGVSEDDIERSLEQLEDLIQKAMNKLEEIQDKKEKDLMNI